MSAVNPELVKKFKNARKILSEDSIGSQIETDVREDEEQSVKLQEIVDILVAAGYFRARIKGLSSFDKVVGGMVWCIESCNVDLDVDLLFRENLSIGQKISLTEKIVAVLPKLKCPNTIEPHQIQGLDFKNIFSVIQWLVKKSLECRQDVALFVRAYALGQFNKTMLIIDKKHKKYCSMIENLSLTSEMYQPHRYYRRKNSGPVDTKSQFQITLLEYGHGDSSFQANISLDKQIQEEQRIADLSEENRDNLNKHYSSLNLEINDTGLQSRNQIIIDSLQGNCQIFTEKCNEFTIYQVSLDNKIKDVKTVLQELRNKQQKAEITIDELYKEVDNSKIKQIEELIMLNDDLKTHESQFKEHCKKELDNLNRLIQKTKIANVTTSVETWTDLGKDINEASKCMKSLRITLAKVNREVALLQRQVDDIPTRAELAQYQKRFVELFNQVAVKHKETKQYYTLYNTLEDTHFWMKKELSLLNSISESYPEALISSKSKEEFLNQFENVIENVINSKSKAIQKLNQEKQTRDQLSNTLQGLVELQRKYVASIKQLGVECRKQEMLVKTEE